MASNKYGNISWNEANHFTYITFTLTFANHGNEVSKFKLVCLKQDIEVQHSLGQLITIQEHIFNLFLNL
jgi:hypothetical protein